jgi:hypothetical protein
MSPRLRYSGFRQTNGLTFRWIFESPQSVKGTQPRGPLDDCLRATTCRLVCGPLVGYISNIVLFTAQFHEHFRDFCGCDNYNIITIYLLTPRHFVRITCFGYS